MTPYLCKTLRFTQLRFPIAVWYTVLQGGTDMATSEAQLRANKKYHDRFHRLQIRITAEEKQRIDMHTAATGESTNAFVQRAIRETITRDTASVPCVSTDVSD